jgi:hypothetical protein
MALHECAKRVSVAAEGGADQFVVVHVVPIYTTRPVPVPPSRPPPIAIFWQLVR